MEAGTEMVLKESICECVVCKLRMRLENFW